MITYIVLAVGLLAAFIGLGPCWRPGRKVASAPLPLTPEGLEDNFFSLADAPPDESETPYLSVVVYAFDRSDTLDTLIRSLTAQRTLFPYEVIMVCNASSRETAALAERFADIPGLRFTFIPPEAHNLSRRKLSFTVGIKAARGTVVLLTGSNMEPSSAGWFQLMAQPFREDPGLGIALGATRFSFTHTYGLVRRYRQFLFVGGICQGLGAALEGKPYRGDWGNLAMRRSLFFDLKGYASTINIETGDDDLFVYQAAESGASAQVVLAPGAIPESHWGESAPRIWKDRRIAYDFTRRWLPNRPFMRAGLLSAMQWTVLLASVAGALLPLVFGDCPQLALPLPWMGVALGGVLWVGFESLQIGFYRRAAQRLGMPRLLFTYPLFSLWRPLGNLLFMLTHRDSSRRNYTWVRG